MELDLAFELKSNRLYDISKFTPLNTKFDKEIEADVD